MGYNFGRRGGRLSRAGSYSAAFPSLGGWAATGVAVPRCTLLLGGLICIFPPVCLSSRLIEKLSLINGGQVPQKHTLLNSLHLKEIPPAHTHHMPYNPRLAVTVAFKAKCISLVLRCGENACSLYLQALQHASAQLKTTLQLELSRPQRSVTAGSSARDAARGCRGALEYYQVQPCA